MNTFRDQSQILEVQNTPNLLSSLAVVLPRYGKSLGGGAETLTRELVLEVCCADGGGAALVPRVEVWTTCANDHRTWDNFHPPGVTEEDGLIVRRFPVADRDLDTFIRAEIAMQEGRPLSLDEQLDWLSAGVNSPELYQHIFNHGPDFSALLFAPYLFATSFWGALIHPERSLMIPCLHNEHYAYLEVFHHVMRSVRGLIFNAPGEMELAKTLFGEELVEEKGGVVGMGFTPGETLPRPVKNKQASYLLYSGRKETGKNLDFLIDCFSFYKTQCPSSSLELRIIGSGSIDFLNELPADVVDLGFVSESEKVLLMEGALALVQPSTNESFSIVIMESWLASTPVLVHADCAVTRGHAEKSSGGLYFGSKAEFVEVVKELTTSVGLADKLGRAGRDYVLSEYSWSAVQDRFLSICQKVGYSFGEESLPEQGEEGSQGVGGTL